MIDRRDHPAVRRLRDARAGKSAFLFIEGARLAEELLASPLAPLEYYFSDDLKKADKTLIRLRESGAKGERMSADVMAFASDLDAPPGLVALARRPPERWETALAGKDPLVVVLDALQNPANAGAVVRAAEAAGAAAVLQSAGGADLLGPKALRAAAGSAFRLPVGGGKTAADWAGFLRARGFRLLAADARGGTAHTSADWSGPVALFLGGEKGFSDEAVRALPAVRIPLKPPVESLNAAVAAGVLLFEAARRRSAA